MSRKKEVDLDKLFSVMVFNISYRTRKEDLHKSFDKFGKIADVYIPKDIHGESRGFGFVRYYDSADAEDALVMDGSLVDGRRVGVQMAKYGPRHGRRSSRSPRPMRRNRSKSRSHSRHAKKKRSISSSRTRSRSREKHSRRTFRSASKSRSDSRSYSPPRPSGDKGGNRKSDRTEKKERRGEHNSSVVNDEKVIDTTIKKEKSLPREDNNANGNIVE